jgi:NTP pyrophosphatase (non-canonical NTP hydrolase)
MTRTAIIVFAALSEDAYEIARSKGWYEPREDHPAIKGERIHSEVTELVDVYARGIEDTPSDKIPAFTKAEEECADIILRALSFAGRYNMRIGAAVLAKLEHNRDRPLRHGGKKF